MRLSAIRLASRPDGLTFAPTDSALALWDQTIQAKASAESRIDVLGIVGVNVTAESVAADLRKAIKGPVRVVINSPGGDAFEGVAIYNLLVEYQGRVTVDVLSLAASAASLIAMAGDRVEMRAASRMMIHSAHGLVAGNQNDMRQFAAVLDAMDRDVAQLYATRSGKSVDEVLALMRKETWMTAEQAVESGFADVAVAAEEKKKAKSQIDITVLCSTAEDFRSAHQRPLAAKGDQRSPVVRLSAHLPGVAGTIQRGTGMKPTTAEQITSFSNQRAAMVERMDAIMAKAAEDGSTLAQEDQQTYDGLALNVREIDGHLVRLQEHEQRMVAKAKPITAAAVDDGNAGQQARQNSGILFAGPKVEPGIRLARIAIAAHRAKGNPELAIAELQGNRRWMDQTPELVKAARVLMTAIPAADTTTAGWASELVYAENLQNEFIEYLRPMTILGRLTGVRRVPFNVRMGSLTGGTTGYWVGQGKAIPMSKGTTSSLSLGITKAAGMAAYDDELLRSSSPSIETMVRDDLAKAVAQVVDTAFIDPNNGGITNEKPASILYGISPTLASGTNAAAVATDVAAVFAAAIAANLNPMSGVWVMSPTTALKLSLMQTSLGNAQYPGITINGGTWQGLPVIVSPNAYVAGSPDFANMIVLILQDEIILADDGGVSIDISNEASIEMLDNPTNLSTGATAATSVVSMFQTQSWAIKAVRYVNWTKRRSAAAAFIRQAAYA